MGWQDFTQRVLPFMGADLLISDLADKLAPQQVYTPTLENGYGSLVIATNTPSAPCEVTCTVVDATGIVPPWSQRQASDSVDPVMFVPPYSYSTASALRVTLTASVNQTINSTTFIWGMSQVAPSMQGTKLVRSDGRDYPLGSNLREAQQSGAGTTAIIAAPGAGVHIMLSSLHFGADVPSGTSVAVQGTIGGTTSNIVRSANNFEQNFVWEKGLLLDANTALSIVVVGAAFGVADATYDLVA